MTNSSYLSSPLYPLYYPNDLECVWKVVNIGSSYMVLTFSDVELDRVDRLEIKLEHEVIVMTILRDTGIPNSITINSTEIWVSFDTDHEGRASGFMMEITVLDTYGEFKKLNILCVWPWGAGGETPWNLKWLFCKYYT